MSSCHLSFEVNIDKPLFLKRLKIENLRNISQADISPDPRLNVLFGPNGAGKTSIIESIVVLSRGRSFRTSQAGELTGPEGASFRVYAEVSNRSEVTDRLGLERSGKHWRARKNGSDLSQLSQLTRSLPLVLMEPNSHLLVSGPPEMRRKYLDWGMFHVKHEFLETWRRFSKILKQRNAALRLRQTDVLDGIDSVFAETGEKLGCLRSQHCKILGLRVTELLKVFNQDLAGLEISYRDGWTKTGLAEALAAGRDRDLDRGMSGIGPHRADIALRIRENTARAMLSRGEQKILSAAFLLSQAEVLREAGESPLVLLDDLASEFDQNHFDRVLERALALGSQVWVTGTREFRNHGSMTTFHVERGLVREVV